MKAKAQIVNLPVYKPGKPIEEVKREYGLTEIIKLASNENPFGPSPTVHNAIQEELINLSLYPDGACFELREALASHYQLSTEQIIMGNGSDEIIQFIARAYLDEQSNTVMASHTFPIYKTSSIIERAEVREVPLQNGVHDLVKMKEQVDAKTKVVWICNPNNPTGTYIPEKELVEFVEGISPEVLIVLDEAYYEYATATDYPNSTPLLSKFPNLVILRTFSKIYGLAALRIGYGLCSPTVMDHLNRVRMPFNTSRIAQKAALAALNDQAYVQYCYEQNQQGIEQLNRAFDNLGLHFFPSQGNFILVEVQKPSSFVFEELLKQGVIVRSGDPLGFPNYIRVTVGTPEQNEKFIQALSKLY